jgi:hypothetical protein
MFLLTLSSDGRAGIAVPANGINGYDERVPTK